MRAIRHKRVGLATANDATRLANNLEQRTANASENLVAVLGAKALVHKVEVVDVHNDGVHCQIHVMAIELLGVTIKVLAVVEARERVPLGRVDYEAILMKLDCALDACQNDLCLRIGLGNKVVGTNLQAFDLGILRCGNNNNGNVRQLGVVS